MKKVYVLHYSDCNIHPLLGMSNLALNEVLLRCMVSIREFCDVDAELVLVDNGSPQEAHDDALNILKLHNIKLDNMIWNRSEQHQGAVGKNLALKDFLQSSADQIFFTSSDTKIGPKFLSTGFQMIEQLGDHVYGHPNLCPYGIGDATKYRTMAFWEKCRTNPEVCAENVSAYFTRYDVDWIYDSWHEPAPISRPIVGVEEHRIPMFFGNRKAVEDTGIPDDSWIFGDEFQHYDQAVACGCRVQHLNSVYLCHLGSLYRTGVGCFNKPLESLSSYKGHH